MRDEEIVVNTLRFLSAEEVEKANSGHPGMPLGAAPMAYTLFGKYLNINPKDPRWINRDRFVLSAGHGSALLYSLLHMYGFDVSIEDLKKFRQLNSKTPGHPEYGHTDGVDASTGPLGQGISMAVGMAIAEERLAAIYNKPDIEIFDHYTYAICGDGDLMEGIGYEAMSLAGHLGLSKLIILYDSNSITIDGTTDISFSEDVKKRFEGFGFQVLEVEDGNDVEKISDAIETAKCEKDRPTIIKITTQIGYGVPGKSGTSGVHGSPLGEDGICKMREFFDWQYDDFEVPERAYEITKRELEEKKKVYDEWKKKEALYREKYEEEYESLKRAFDGRVDENIFDNAFFEFEKPMATRASSGIALNRIAEKCEFLVGGSADLAASNKTDIKGGGDFSKEDRTGRNIHFGIREHAMAAIGNGMMLHGGVRSFIATFLVFSDYLKPALRLSAMMKLPLIYILTHDSIGVGEDGPTHQPIEQYAMLRSIPNVEFFRPADSVETAYAWKCAITSESTPTVLALTRQTLPDIEGSGAGVENGGYIISKETHDLEIILLGSGSEVQHLIKAQEKLEKDGIGTRVVSMVSMERFEKQSDAYKEEVLPKNIKKRISLEAASTFGWAKYTGLYGKTIGIDEFGRSGPASDVFEFFDISAERVYDEAKNL